MLRSLFALSLLLFASTALADGAIAAGDPADPGGKPGKTSSVTSAQDGEAGTTAPVAAPARSAPRPSATPRWNSLLPGMIR